MTHPTPAVPSAVLRALIHAVPARWTRIARTPVAAPDHGETWYWNHASQFQRDSLRTVVLTGPVTPSTPTPRVRDARIHMLSASSGWLFLLKLDARLLQDASQEDAHHLLLAAAHALRTGQWLVPGLQGALANPWGEVPG